MISALILALAAAQQAPGDEIVLRVMTHERWFAGFAAMEEVTRTFEAEHPGVRVELISSSGGSGSRDKIKFALAGDLPIDVTWIDVTEFSSFLDEGVLVDLQPYFDADPAWRESDYFAEILAGMRDRRGHLYGLPSTFNPYVMYVNRSLLDEAGIAVPDDDWTWDDLVRIGRQVTADLDGDGRNDRFGVSLTQWLQAITPWIWQNGGRLLDDDGRVSLDAPATVEAVAFLQDLLHQEKIASDDATFANQLSVSLFQAGRVAFYGPVGYWETYRFREIEDFEWDYLPLPRGKEAATAVAMRFYCVPRTARHPQLAYQFVRALAGPTMQRGLAEIGNGVPGLISAARSESFLDPDSPQREEVFLEVLPYARFLPIRINWAEIQEIAGSWLDQALLLNTLSAEQACRGAAEAANLSLARDQDIRHRPRLARSHFLLAWAVPALALITWLLSRLARRSHRRERAAWLFLAPWAIGFTLLLAGPALVSALLSFSEWSPVQQLDQARWMGLDQYRRLAEDPVFHDSLGVTLRYALMAVPLQLLVALGLALLLHRPRRGQGIARTVFYLPAILSPVILGAMWRWILDGELGAFNQALAGVGLRGPDWLQDPHWVVPSFVLMSLWTVGAQMLVFLAGLQGVDPRLHEAARLDGASSWRRLLHVTLPALSPVMLFNLIVGLINAFQIFAQPFVMTQGGPGNESRFLVIYLYDQAFRNLRMGYASTLAWVLLAMVGLLTIVVLRSARHWVHYAGRSR